MSALLIGDKGYAKLLGFGIRRLKIVLWLSQHPEVDDLGWNGELTIRIGSVQERRAPSVSVQMTTVPEYVKLPDEQQVAA